MQNFCSEIFLYINKIDVSDISGWMSALPIFEADLSLLAKVIVRDVSRFAIIRYFCTHKQKMKIKKKGNQENCSTHVLVHFDASGVDEACRVESCYIYNV